MRFVKYHIPIFVLILFLVFLAAVYRVYHSYPQQPPLALKILQDNGCSVPCWDDLRIGDTEDKIRLLYKEHFTQFDEYKRRT